MTIKIQILGPGCPKCKQLAANAEEAAKAIGVDYELVKVTDINDITKFGVMLTPGIAVDGQVKASGKLISAEQIKQWLK